MTSATAADYGWIRSSSSLFNYALEMGYTLTLVQGVSSAELLRAAGAEPRGMCEGIGELMEQHTGDLVRIRVLTRVVPGGSVHCAWRGRGLDPRSGVRR
ncbi:DUF6461 domain-containing protein [Streptomyces sp. NPDC006430]|uniref:DUF6461 domain-containing protein n=1 Tax=Streptomyces sp. NPDC006430 TaxID=3154299 RepID=UPI0033ACAEE0